MNRTKSAIVPLFNGQKVLTSASEKAKLFARLFSKKFNVDDSGNELPTFSHRTNTTLSNMVITPKMVEKATSKPDSSMASGPDGILVVVLKNCEPELSFVLTDIFNLYLKQCFPDCWKVICCSSV